METGLISKNLFLWWIFLFQLKSNRANALLSGKGVWLHPTSSTWTSLALLEALQLPHTRFLFQLVSTVYPTRALRILTRNPSSFELFLATYLQLRVIHKLENIQVILCNNVGHWRHGLCLLYGVLWKITFWYAHTHFQNWFQK